MVNSWKEVKRKRVYDGWRKMDRITYQLPSGKQSDFDIKIDGQSVCALVVTSDGKFILNKQFRPGPAKVLIELPGGGLEPNEEPMDAIAREVLEETGYKGDVEFAGTAYKDAYSDYKQHNFLITNAVQVTEPLSDPNEPGEVIEMDKATLLAHLDTGELTDLTTAYQAFRKLELAE